MRPCRRIYKKDKNITHKTIDKPEEISFETEYQKFIEQLKFQTYISEKIIIVKYLLDISATV